MSGRHAAAVAGGQLLVVADPAPDTLVFPSGRARPGYPTAEIPRFGQDYWQLAASTTGRPREA
jgi:hypothetical protein